MRTLDDDLTYKIAVDGAHTQRLSLLGAQIETGVTKTETLRILLHLTCKHKIIWQWQQAKLYYMLSARSAQHNMQQLCNSASD